MKKSTRIFLKIVAFPFKLAGKTVYYAGKGIFYLGKGLFNAGKYTGAKMKESLQKRKLQSLKPKSPAVYNGLEKIKIIAGNHEDFEKLLNSPGKISIILGGRGTGKSALGMRILENINANSKRKVQAWGFDSSRLPDWIIPVSSISELDNNSHVLVDESGISFSSRNSMSELNKLLTELLLIARHKNISLFFISQNSSNIDVNILRQADMLMMKPHSLLQLDFERKIIKDIYEKTSNQFKNLKSIPGITYIHSEDFKGFVKNSLPSFWSEKLSKSFADEKIESKKE